MTPSEIKSLAAGRAVRPVDVARRAAEILGYARPPKGRLRSLEVAAGIVRDAGPGRSADRHALAQAWSELLGVTLERLWPPSTRNT